QRNAFANATVQSSGEVKRLVRSPQLGPVAEEAQQYCCGTGQDAVPQLTAGETVGAVTPASGPGAEAPACACVPSDRSRSANRHAGSVSPALASAMADPHRPPAMPGE